MKFFIDSRDRVDGSNESFTWKLPITLDLESEHVAILDTVLIPNNFQAVVEGYNDRIYISETQPQTVPTFVVQEAHRIALIPPGHYSASTLASAVANALNAGSILTNSYTVVFDSMSSKLRISNALDSGASFSILPRQYLKDNVSLWNSLSATQVTGDLHDAGWVCGFLGSAPLVGPNTISDSTVNLATHHNLFIRSSIASPGHCWGPHGASDIIRRVVMDSPVNALTIDRHATSYDTIMIAPQTLTSIDFRLCDYAGNTVDLRGAPWSFSLCLVPA